MIFKAFDSEESDINKRYGMNLERNILGVYEEGSLEVMQAHFKTVLDSIHKGLIHLKSMKVQIDEKITSCSRDIEDGKAEQGELRQQLLYQKKLLSGYEEQLAARRYWRMNITGWKPVNYWNYPRSSMNY